MAGVAKYTKWLEEENLRLLEWWARDGLTDEDLAKKMDIAVGTLYDWKKAHPLIAEAIKKGKEPVDYGVEDSLLKRAMGYEYTETKTIVLGERREGADELQNVQIIRQERIRKHVPPDTGAACMWLKNRKPEKWKDRHEVDVQTPLSITIEDDYGE